ncbi:hypothetical protein STRIP9103_04412 [Streptomyces ipomoeae 91-03]|uniref:Uncharacterized protein n=1 Tax=Streptomyces ipomoeae 91-03 TaxID=698759 RepID=L1KVS6_9ACTN|nr:hypothetical protein STRIP9103_04412 [Streptomyces ipomoeae 91-03]
MKGPLPAPAYAVVMSYALVVMSYGLVPSYAFGTPLPP